MVVGNVDLSGLGALMTIDLDVPARIGIGLALSNVSGVEDAEPRVLLLLDERQRSELTLYQP